MGEGKLMRVLVIGSGGREHALAWKCAQSDKVEQVFAAPGNGGTAMESKIENIPIGAMDFDLLADFAEKNNVALTIAGPEAPLVAGVTDYFQRRGLACFGPVAQAARLEGSKSFSKDFMRRHGIPTAAYEVFTEVKPAAAFAREHGAPIVVKADGLAAGKGVTVAQTEDEAIAAIEDMLSGNRFGEAGHRVVVEEFLAGEEASFIVMSDGTNILPMATSQDHKARDDGDKGPNTGGMGAYSPAPVVTEEVHERIMDQVIRPTIAGMAADGYPYVGFLYAGLMIAPDGAVSVVEFNCRFGDPEAQPIMMRLQSDLAGLCLSAVNGGLDSVAAQWDPRSCLGVVLAAGGYPGSYAKGKPIKGLDRDLGKGRKVFHAGTARQAPAAPMGDPIVLTNGGRVLCATALGGNIAAARQAAYAVVEDILSNQRAGAEFESGAAWTDVHYRADIGHRALDRQ